jgi:transcriptional regulator with XRE-family HTH domain
MLESMTKRPVQQRQQRRRIFLKEWREYRNLTQEALADRVGMSVSNISQLERGLQGYSDDGLQALAHALRTEPGYILSVNPLDEDGIWSLWERALPGQRQVIHDVARGLVDKKVG